MSGINNGFPAEEWKVRKFSEFKRASWEGWRGNVECRIKQGESAAYIHSIPMLLFLTCKGKGILQLPGLQNSATSGACEGDFNSSCLIQNNGADAKDV